MIKIIKIKKNATSVRRLLKILFMIFLNKAYSFRGQINDGVVYIVNQKKECKSITWKLRVRRNSNSS